MAPRHKYQDLITEASFSRVLIHPGSVVAAVPLYVEVHMAL